MGKQGNKMLDIKSLLKKVSEKFISKTMFDNKETKIRNFIIIPNAGIVMATENSGLSHKDILKKLMYDNGYIQNAIMNYPCGYYKSDKIVFFQGDLSMPETVRPLMSDNILIVKNKLAELKKMLRCGDNVSVQFYAKVEKIRDIIGFFLYAKTKYLSQKSK